jgi:hypothetical protein
MSRQAKVDIKNKKLFKVETFKTSVSIANGLNLEKDSHKTVFINFYICLMPSLTGYRRLYPSVIFRIIFISLAFFSCSKKKTSSIQTLFSLLPPAQTGINFRNKVADNDEMNIFNYHNFYNGGGVAIGDINNDGKADIFFTSNQGDNKLFLNKGNWKFEDITAKAGLTSNHHWHTGVTMADIDGDGWLDIYVSNGGIIKGDDRANELYINQKNGTFKEEAHWFGLDDKGVSTQAVFFDYDHDGDLDCFVLNNSPKSLSGFGYTSSLRTVRDTINGDRLYKNEGGKFVDVSEQAGIYGSEIAFGLGVTVGDVNNDGWEDMYVSNDFFEKDYLYINQKNGSFKETINDAMGHISNGSMGSDMADINNDGYLDIFTTEMLPEDDYRLKTSIKFEDYDVQAARNRYDFHQQFTCNCLQLNNHDGHFCEIAQLAGVDATGWSWGALSFDFDNDGWKDLFVANGIAKDLTNQDFLEFINSGEAKAQLRNSANPSKELLEKLKSDPIPNYGFINQKNLRFKNESEQLGLATPGFSNGAAYADLDNDGDADLVVNNVNSDAFVYRNMASETLHHHFLKVKINGNKPNTFGVGAKVTVFAKADQQLLVQMPSRGFQSSVEPVLNFGLGAVTTLDSLLVEWPDDRIELIKNIKADTTIVLWQKRATEFKKPLKLPDPLYVNMASSTIIGNYQHRENEYVDFDAERLLPKMLSTEGPKLAVGDVNGDGLEDFYLGNATADTAKIFIQKPNGQFVQKTQQAFIDDKYIESVGAVFFDADNDGDNDLLVASGGNIAPPGSSNLYPRLYLNDGKGNFSRSRNGLPAIAINAGCVRINDFDLDGKPDIFIGGRNVPGSYGLIPASYLLRNNGNGSFTDITKTIAPDLSKIGMVTDAEWADIDGDNQKELIVVGDWMPVVVFKNQNGKFKKTEIPHSSGWWNCLTVTDVNGDGKPDLVAGNFGLNSNIKADVNHPAKLYVSDFDKNGRTETIPVYYKADGKAYPYFLKGEIEAQIPQLKKKLLRFNEYAGKTIDEIFTPEQLKEAAVLTVEQTQTSVFINDGKGNFSVQPLPVMAQLSPVFAILVSDLNNDGIKDIFLAGNFYGLKPQTGRLDASYGTTLLGDKNSHFNYINQLQSGLFVKGEARDIASVRTAKNGEYVAVAMNNDKLCLFKKVRP